MRFLCFLTFTFTSAKLAINGRFDDKLRYELNRHLAQVDIPNAPDVPVDARFTRHNTERLQRALAEYGRLPITSQLDSLAISTFQGYLRSLGFYHDKPCGILGHGTVTAIQEFLTSQGTYRYQTTGRYNRLLCTWVAHFTLFPVLTRAPNRQWMNICTTCNSQQAVTDSDIAICGHIQPLKRCENICTILEPRLISPLPMLFFFISGELLFFNLYHFQ